MSRNRKEVRFAYNFMNREIKIPNENFVPLEKKIEFIMLDLMSQHLVRHMYPQNISYKISSWRWHYCGWYGHIRPIVINCMDIPSHTVNQGLTKKIGNKIQEMKVGKLKEIIRSLIVYTFFRVSSREYW